MWGESDLRKSSKKKKKEKEEFLVFREPSKNRLPRSTLNSKTEEIEDGLTEIEDVAR